MQTANSNNLRLLLFEAKELQLAVASLLFWGEICPFPVQWRSSRYCASGTSSCDVKRALLETHVFPKHFLLPPTRWQITTLCDTPAWYNVKVNLNGTHSPTYVVASFFQVYISFSTTIQREWREGWLCLTLASYSTGDHAPQDPPRCAGALTVSLNTLGNVQMCSYVIFTSSQPPHLKWNQSDIWHKRLPAKAWVRGDRQTLLSDIDASD